MRTGLMSVVAVLALGLGCHESQEAVMQKLLAKLQPGMSREQVREVLGKRGRQHLWKTERSRVPEGRTEERQREFEIQKKADFKLLVPGDLLETMPLAGGATEVEHYVFNKRYRFAAGYEFEEVLLFYDARKDVLLGYGYDPRGVSGRPDLKDREFFFHGEILAP